MLCHMDRLNLGFASLTMNKDLGFGPEVYGFGAGIFFIGYALFEIPSNFALRKFGAPAWIGRIMVTWGLATCTMAFVRGEWSFYFVRFMLGVAEAGFTPGIIYYFSQWYVKEHRGRALGLFAMGPAIAGIIGAPLAGLVLKMDAFGLAGWQWIFILEGIPTLIFGLLLPRLMPSQPQAADWLPAENKAWLTAELAREDAEKARTPGGHNFLEALKSGPIWIYGAAYFCCSVGLFSLFFWSPQLIKGGFPQITNFAVTVLSSLPFAAALIGSVVAGWNSDRTGDRRWHLVGSGLLAAVLLLASTQSANPIYGFLAIVVAVGCSYVFIVTFWPNPMGVLGGPAAAGGLALINSIGLLGGFTGPYVVGLLKGYTGSFTLSITFFAIFFLLMGLIPLTFPRLFPRAEPGNRHGLPVSLAART
jgi:ACS family tartrate transporter-like MFS transporter